MKAFCEKCFKDVEIDARHVCPGCGHDLSETRKGETHRRDREHAAADRWFHVPWRLGIPLLAIPLALAAMFWFGRGPARDAGTLLRQACEALRDGDWNRYRLLTITHADFLMKNQGFKSELGYAATLRQEAQARLHKQFDAAVAGGAGRIDFRRAAYVGPGTLLRQETSDLLDGAAVPLRIYSVRIRLDGAELDTKDLYPRFVLAKWGEGERIYDLEFPPEEPK